MKEIIIKTGIAVLNIVYFFFKLLPVKDKIVYISRQHNQAPEDFKLTAECLGQLAPQYEQVILAKRIPPGLVGKIFYCFHILEQMYHIATARAVLLDTYCIPVSILKQRKNLIVVQMWHALGAFKKFGYSILDQKEGRSRKEAELMHMHENYTHVLTSSPYAAPFFAEAFHVSMDQMYVYPLPKTDFLTDSKRVEESRERVYAQYPRLRDAEKKVIVYAPTFRMESEDELYKAVCCLIDKVDFDRYEFVLKKHPLVKFTIEDDRIIEDKELSTMDFLTASDVIITDYSAVLFEALFVEKEIYFYAFDYAYYMAEREFYLDYEKEMPGPIGKTAEELICLLDSGAYDYEKAKEFKNKMIVPCKKSYTEDFVEFLLEELETGK